MSGAFAGAGTRCLPWVALAGLCVAVGLQKIRSFDYWWHLRTGRLIAETCAVPREDLYTFSAEGARWIDIHWLFQLGLYGLYELGGHGLVVFAKVAGILALVVVLGRIGFRHDRAGVSVAGLALVVLIGGDRFMPRPELVSFVLLACVLCLLDRFHTKRDAWIYAIVPIQLLWVNVHGLFALGIALCAIHLSAAVLDGLVRRGTRLDARRIAPLLAVTGLACGAALASPNTLDAALYPLQQLGMIGTSAQRAASLATRELVPLTWYWPDLTTLAKALAVSVAGASLAAMILNRRRLRTSDVLCWLAFLLLAIAAARNLLLFAIVATPIAVRNGNEALDARASRWAAPHWGALGLAALLVVVAADVARGRFFTRLGSLREPGVGVMEVIHPVAATDWIERERPEGPVFHSMVDGGYLTWRLFPDYRTLIDGRLEVFGIERRLELNARLPRDFEALDRRYRFELALLNFGQIDYTRLLRHLHRSEDWALVFVDDVAAVFERRTADRSPDEVDLDDPRLLADAGMERGIGDAYRARGRIRFFRAIGRADRAREIAREMVARYPELRRQAER